MERDHSPETVPVVEIFHKLTDAWIRGDLTTLDRHYHDKIIGLEPEPPYRLLGKEKVLREYGKFLESGGRIEFLRSRDIKVEMFGDTALLTYFFQTRRMLPGGRGREFSGKETLLFVRQGGHWKLAHWHYSIDPPAAKTRARGAPIRVLPVK